MNDVRTISLLVALGIDGLGFLAFGQKFFHASIVVIVIWGLLAAIITKISNDAF